MYRASVCRRDSLMSVDLWRIDLDLADDVLIELCESLSPDEMQRAERYRFPHLRGRFIAARSALRSVLGSRLGISPAQLSFCYSSHGKPTLPDCSIRFNLSHSGSVALLALTCDTEIGVDVEHVVSTIDVHGIARSMFSPSEIGALEASPPDLQTDFFFTIWTRKEACIKASGVGLSADTKSFSVWPGDVTEDGWHVRSLDVHAGYAAALATSVPSGPIQIHHLTRHRTATGREREAPVD
jgi:4'-phosphopantetheinyl transferase